MSRTRGLVPLFLALLLLPAASADFASDMVALTEDSVGRVAGRALPAQTDVLLLVGHGQAYVERSGAGAACDGESTIVLEGSHKPLGLEPAVTFWYAGAKQEGGLLLPCVMGQGRQPFTYEIVGSFEGAWSAQRSVLGDTWLLEVGAPAADGARSVRFTLTNNGSGIVVDQFEGLVFDYR
jgi:hypothetical protein